MQGFSIQRVDGRKMLKNILLTPFRAQNPLNGRNNWCNSSSVGGRPCLGTSTTSSIQTKIEWS